MRAEIIAGTLGVEHRLFLTYLDEVLQNVILITGLCKEDNGYLMDLEFYPPDMPLGGLEFAIVKIIEVLAAEGCHVLSMGARMVARWGLRTTRMRRSTRYWRNCGHRTFLMTPAIFSSRTSSGPRINRYSFAADRRRPSRKRDRHHHDDCRSAEEPDGRRTGLPIADCSETGCA